MTLLRIRVSMIDASKATALLHRLEDVAISHHTKGMVEGETVIMDVDEQDIPAVKRALAYHHNWIATN